MENIKNNKSYHGSSKGSSGIRGEKTIWEEYYPLIQPANQYPSIDTPGYIIHGVLFPTPIVNAYKNAVLAFLVVLLSIITFASTGLIFCHIWGLKQPHPFITFSQILWFISPAIASIALRKIAQIRISRNQNTVHYVIPHFRLMFRSFEKYTMLRLLLLSYSIPLLCEIAAYTFTVLLHVVNPVNIGFVERIQSIYYNKNLDNDEMNDSKIVSYIISQLTIGIVWDPYPPENYDFGLLLSNKSLGCSWFLLSLIQEIGWSGTLYPALEIIYAHSTFLASLLTGLLWALWHWPFMIFTKIQIFPKLSGYEIADTGNDPLIYSLTAFTLLCIGSRLIMCWIQGRSCCIIWSSVVYHAAYNLFVVSVFGQLVSPIYSRAFLYNFFTSESSVCLVITVWFSTCILSKLFRCHGLAYLFNRRRIK